MLRRTALILVAAAPACSPSAPEAPRDLRAQRVERLAQIASHCGLPSESLELVGTHDVHFQPPADARYVRVDCVLTALKKTDMATKMGFVGNETPAPEIRP